jgi:secondary thiamine-phosphate synthase enzyme
MEAGGIYMEWFKEKIIIETSGKGLYPITHQLTPYIQSWEIQEGICHLFIPHTSASLVINESYDPSARQDMEAFMDNLVPEGEPWYRHTQEGRDDSPSHMRASLTATTLSIPIDEGVLSLGTWQGVYLFEHRVRSHHRSVLIRCLKVD